MPNPVELLRKKIVDNLDIIAESIANNITDRFMESLQSYGATEQVADPAHPVHFLQEFNGFLKKTVMENTVLTNEGLTIHTGDDERLGFDQPLEDDETDPIRIIGTVIQGIAGEYVLILPEQARKMFGARFNESRMGRLGGAFVMPVREYEDGMMNYGWPDADVWEFSNFPGMPDLFDGSLLEDIVSQKIEEVLLR